MPACTRPAHVIIVLSALVAFGVAAPAASAAHVGYYRQPALHGDTIVFCAEGDLWMVEAGGGLARRLTSHLGEETTPSISADGATIAFCAEYEGPTEVYTIPIEGGIPVRQTYGSERPAVASWTPDGAVLYTSRHDSGLPDWRLFTIDPATHAQEAVPLNQAADGIIGDDGAIYFTRLPFQGSYTKRYKGGMARSIWRFAGDDDEASHLTKDDEGENFAPMWWQGRVYFVSDRDGTKNLWSMRPDGTEPRQHTRHRGFDVQWPSLSQGRIAYQLGADLYMLNIASGATAQLSIELTSDLDQKREHWIDKPMSWLTSAHPSPDGERVVVTARGEVFVLPRRSGRRVHASRDSSVRWRQVKYLPGEDDNTLLGLADGTGEIELWTLPADGVGEGTTLSNNGEIFRFDPEPSPDGKRVAYQDKNFVLWIYERATNEHTRVASTDSTWDAFADLAWSPDSRWLAFVRPARNGFSQIALYHVDDASITAVTSDRINSRSPAWSPDGAWLYFLSDRHFETLTAGPWGQYQPEPFLDRMTKIYVVSLTPERRSPFAEADELHADDAADKDKDADKGDDEDKGDDKDKGDDDKDKGDDDKDKDAAAAAILTLDRRSIERRAIEVPVEPGNYGALSVTDKHLYWTSSGIQRPIKRSLQSLAIKPLYTGPGERVPKVETIAEDIKSYELTANHKRLLIQTDDALAIVDANGKKADLKEGRLDLSGWRFPLDPAAEWQQMFVEAWRLERDFFYDPGMHGVDWDEVLRRHLPLVDRVTTRAELSDLIAQMVGELSALHIFVRNGDQRSGADQINQGSLGARLASDPATGRWRVVRVYAHDPDFPDRASPLADPEVDAQPGDEIVQINGVDVASVPDIGVLLRDTAGRQVRLRLRRGPAGVDSGVDSDVIVTPITMGAERRLRYGEWELTRRQMAEELGDGDIGYVHLQAMGGANYLEFAQSFYPVFNRAGLIIDVRHNNGGNIDSWILEKLMRQAWMYWQGRVGRPEWNMQYAFRGHIVVLCDERTASDGEAFCEGFRRLGLGKVIGTRTWGGEIWLSSSNVLVDKGIATAAEWGVYGPEGEWLIEGRGFEPDIVVDNLPHATFGGRDAQLEAAVRHLRGLIAADPRPVPPAPPMPQKAGP